MKAIVNTTIIISFVLLIFLAVLDSRLAQLDLQNETRTGEMAQLAEVHMPADVSSVIRTQER